MEDLVLAPIMEIKVSVKNVSFLKTRMRKNIHIWHGETAAMKSKEIIKAKKEIYNKSQEVEVTVYSIVIICFSIVSIAALVTKNHYAHLIWYIMFLMNYKFEDERIKRYLEEDTDEK